MISYWDYFSIKGVRNYVVPLNLSLLESVTRYNNRRFLDRLQPDTAYFPCYRKIGSGKG